MLKRDDSFTSVVRAALAATQVTERLRHGEAVILERIARGGGATNWYYCRSPSEMPTIEALLHPGSVVSFYFDGRVQHSRNSPELMNALEDKIHKNGELVVGLLGKDRIRIEATIVVSLEDLAELVSAIDTASELFHGAFPGRDNDGRQAVTITLPDADGSLGSHPH